MEDINLHNSLAQAPKPRSILREYAWTWTTADLVVAADVILAEDQAKTQNGLE